MDSWFCIWQCLKDIFATNSAKNNEFQQKIEICKLHIGLDMSGVSGWLILLHIITKHHFRVSKLHKRQKQCILLGVEGQLEGSNARWMPNFQRGNQKKLLERVGKNRPYVPWKALWINATQNAEGHWGQRRSHQALEFIYPSKNRNVISLAIINQRTIWWQIMRFLWLR